MGPQRSKLRAAGIRGFLEMSGLYLFGVEHPDCGDDLGKALVARCVEVGQIIQELGHNAIRALDRK